MTDNVVDLRGEKIVTPDPKSEVEQLVDFLVQNREQIDQIAVFAILKDGTVIMRRAGMLHFTLIGLMEHARATLWEELE